MYKVTGNTYPARDQLRKLGFAWTGKDWIGSNKAGFDAWIAKCKSPGYGVAAWKMADALRIEDIGDL